MALYQRILVPIDGSPTSKRGLDEAIRIAQLTGGALRLIHVADEISVAFAMNAYAGVPGDWSERIRADGARLLEEAQSRVAAAGIASEAVQVDNFSGAVHEKIVEEAGRWPADLIVLGTHGRRGIGRLVLGSSAENVLRSDAVPVLLVRGSDSES